jgi:hypothetical protein
MTSAGHVARIGPKRQAYRILVGKPKEKGPLGGSRRGSEDNIKIDLRETERCGMDWIDLTQDRWKALMNTVRNLRIP